MSFTLDANEKQLLDLHGSLATRIAEALDRSGTFYRFDATSYPGTSVTYALRCGVDKLKGLVLDDKGQELVVTPIATGRGWQALLGVSTSWGRLKSKRRDFDSAQIIAFLEPTDPDATGVADPIQLMRLEWESLERNNNIRGAIAHPHWQIDIGRHVLRRTPLPPALEVSPTIPASGGGDGLAWLSKLHLAACARWMERPWSEDVYPAPHVDGPHNLDQLADWMFSACKYLHHQINGAIGD